MTVEEVMQDPYANKAGWLALILTWAGGAWNWLTEYGNELMVIISGLVGLFFLFLKIKIARIELKLKQKELEEAEKDDNEQSLDQ